MKKLLIFILISINVANNIFAQDLPITKVLDEKNGFKDFKIGDSFYKWQNDITYTNSNNNIKFYNYNGLCCQQIFNIDLAYIRLGFKDEKLVVIYLETTVHKNDSKGWVSTEYKLIKSSFENLFNLSTPDIYSDQNGNSDVTSFWPGEKLFLTLTYVYEGVKEFAGGFSKTGKCTIMIGLNVPVSDGF